MRNKIFATVVNSMPDVAAVVDAAGKVQFLNTAGCKFLGLRQEQAIGKPLGEVCPAKILVQVRALCKKAVRTAELQALELSGSLLDGEPYTTDLQAVPMTAAGEVTQVLLLSHDITDRKQAERQREDYLQRLDALLELSLGLLRVNDVYSLLEGVTAAARRLTNAQIGLTTHTSSDGEWVQGPYQHADGSMPNMAPSFVKQMSGTVQNLLRPGSSVVRLSPPQMHGRPLSHDMPDSHVALQNAMAGRIENPYGKTTCLIMLGNKKDAEFSSEDETLLKHLMALASLALQHIEARSQSEERAKQAEEGQRKLETISDTLAKTATELAQSNKDLEQFAYIASHDLQEPLRMITGFLNLLQQQYHGHIDKTAEEYISFAIDGAARMQTLISDLLAYSRIGSHDVSFAETDLNVVVDQVLALLNRPLSDSGADIKRDLLPTIIADDSQMIQLYQNLLANSLKFRTAEKPRIHIGAQQENGQWLFWVRDNGIGFPQSQAERVFMIFQRLHPRDKYQGSGLGLAICRRVVERHHGLIWAESQPGNGATFYFTLNS